VLFVTKKLSYGSPRSETQFESSSRSVRECQSENSCVAPRGCCHTQQFAPGEPLHDCWVEAIENEVSTCNAFVNDVSSFLFYIHFLVASALMHDPRPNSKSTHLHPEEGALGDHLFPSSLKAIDGDSYRGREIRTPGLECRAMDFGLWARGGDVRAMLKRSR